MSKLTRKDLYSLEQYAEIRDDFRAKVMAHKQNRKVALGPNMTLYFEDRLTMQYQIQEMLRIEKIFETTGIEDELATYNSLIPDGSNWKATFMIEYSDVEERKAALERMIGIEDNIWVQVAGHGKAFAIADEDLEREDATKTSAVHFLRFELTPQMVSSVKSGVAVVIGIDHHEFGQQVDVVEQGNRESLVADLV